MTPVNPSTIQSPTLWQRLTSQFGIKSRTAAPELGGVVHPVAILEDFTKLGTFDKNSPRVFAGRAGLTSGAGNTPKVGLRVPGGASSALVDRVYVVSNVAGVACFLSTSQAALAVNTAPNQLGYLDSRIAWNVAAPLPPFLLQTEDSITSPFGQQLHEVITVANQVMTFEFPYPIYVGPGSTLLIETSTVAVQIRVTFLGREVPFLL